MLLSLLSGVCRCPVCHESPEPRAFPLCGPCLDSLILSPALCRYCLDPGCPGARRENCLRPWASLDEAPLESVTAAYLSLGPGYEVLKSWKKIGGPVFDRQILPSDDALRELRNRIVSATILPMPQELGRSWRLGRSPAERLARWISDKTDWEVAAALERAPGPAMAVLRQAERTLESRLKESPGFQLSEGTQLRGPALIVDDFLTSGKTIRAAARALTRAGASEIHAFVLGVRPRLDALS